MSARSPIIVNYTILADNTWEKAISAIGAVRKWFFKTRESTDNEYRYAFVPSPTTYMTNASQGAAFDNCEIPDIYVYGIAGTVIEIIYCQ